MPHKACAAYIRCLARMEAFNIAVERYPRAFSGLGREHACFDPWFVFGCLIFSVTGAAGLRL
jgi:hypothetical protein